ncbi:MAG TPA: metallopeptidase TldD-related protein [Thermomicrobiaceae bacterium]|nr:metallopeptidase TldD-related protein [Thermomicrobiaceae bacterium]
MTLATAAEAVLAAAGRDALEVFALSRRVRTRRWRGDEPAGELLRHERGIAVRVRREGRVGLAAACGPFDAADLVASARVAARSGPAFPSSFAEHPVASEDAAAGPEAPDKCSEPPVRELAQRLHDRHPDARLSLQFVESEEERLILSTEGVRAYDCRRATMVRAIASRADSGEVLDLFYEAPWPADSTDVDALLRWLVLRLRWTRRRAAMPCNDLPVILTPRALDALVAQPLAAALAGPALLDGTSFLSGQRPEEPSVRGLTLLDDPTLTGAPRSRRFDDEGVPTRRRELLRRGVVAGYALDLSAAERLGMESTGSAWRRWDAWPAAEPATLVVHGGSTDVTRLLGTWPRAVLIDEVAGEWFSDVGEAGVAASAHLAFLVEGGEVVGRVRGVSLSAARDDLLRGEVVLSQEVAWVGDRALLPWVHAAGLAVSDADV